MRSERRRRKASCIRQSIGKDREGEGGGGLESAVMKQKKKKTAELFIKKQLKGCSPCKNAAAPFSEAPVVIANRQGSHFHQETLPVAWRGMTPPPARYCDPLLVSVCFLFSRLLYSTVKGEGRSQWETEKRTAKT